MTDADRNEALLETAVAAARRAGEVLMEGFGSHFSVSTKTGVHDLVSEYDRKAEDAILGYIGSVFPDHDILSEEAGTLTHTDHSVRWIIDPLDGTLNFCRSIPYFAISIAAELQGNLLCGVVYNPVADELFRARKGGGAWLNDRQIHVSDNASLEKAVMAIGLPFNTVADPHHCLSLASEVGGRGAQLLRMGSTAMNLAYVADGRFDGFWETDCFPWDVAAGVLLVREAGGIATDLAGEKQNPLAGGIAAANMALHKELMPLLGAAPQDG